MTFDEFLKAACPPLDLDWRKYRRRAARHRIDARLEELGLDGYAAYLERLRNDLEEAAGLADRMCVTVSRFYRERQRWEILAARVLPRLAHQHPDRPLRAWSVGCCCGEEPYTLALLCREHFPGLEPDILASDIDAAALDRARRGAYRKSSLKEVPQAVLEKYFRRGNDLWRLDETLRGAVRFRRHNFMCEPALGEFDMVCCRYLAFTYYRGERLREAARRLRRALRLGGALMIGRREDLGPAAELFEDWPEAPGVFRRPRARLDDPEGTGIG